MAICKVQYGIDNRCGDLLFPGGADKDFWVGYTSDLGTRFDLTQTGALSAIQFAAYAGLVKFEGIKYSNSFDYETVVGAGGNIFYTHKALVKLIALSTQDDVEIQRLTQAQDAFIVYQNNNEQFFIMGASKGLKAVAGPLGGTGVQAADNVADMVTLQGEEKTKPLRFFATSVTNTLSLLNGYVR